MTHPYERVLVVGGGIGGLTAAVALAQAGCQVDLVELQSEFKYSGVGIIQPSNALRALDTLGLAQACLEQGYPYDRYDYMDAAGKLLNSIPGPRASSHLPPYNGIFRGRLQDILLAAARSAGASIRMAASVASLQPSADRVDVRFTDGSQGTYSLVVAADGINSACRRMLFGDGAQPTATGQSVWRVTMPRPPEVTSGVMVMGSSSKAGFIPLSPEHMYLLLVTREDPKAFIPQDALRAILLDRLEGFGGLVAACRDHIVPQEIVYRPLEVVLMPLPWVSQRIVVVGDAAHASTPHLGQGAAMAIEDVVVLAELVRQGVPAHMLGDSWQHRRHARAAFFQDSSIAIGDYEMGKRPDLNLFGLLAQVRERIVEPH